MIYGCVAQSIPITLKGVGLLAALTHRKPLLCAGLKGFDRFVAYSTFMVAGIDNNFLQITTRFFWFAFVITLFLASVIILAFVQCAYHLRQIRRFLYIGPPLACTIKQFP